MKLVSSALRAGFLSLVILTSIPARAALGPNENPDQQTPAEIQRAKEQIERDFANRTELPQLTDKQRKEILARYAHLDPRHEVPSDMLADAVVFYDTHKTGFANSDVISVVDFRRRSDRVRFYVIDLRTGVVDKYHTTHGVNSDPKDTGYATTFGNENNSGQSSVGFIRTGERYNGTFGWAVRLDGISASNSNLRLRSVVVHGWGGAHEEDVIQQRSHGCMALDWKIKDDVVDRIKEGSMIYAGVSKGARFFLQKQRANLPTAN